MNPDSEAEIEVDWGGTIRPDIDAGLLEKEMTKLRDLHSVEPVKGCGTWNFWHFVYLPASMANEDDAVRTSAELVEEAAANIVRDPVVDIEHINDVNVATYGKLEFTLEAALNSRKGEPLSDRDAEDIADELEKRFKGEDLTIREATPTHYTPESNPVITLKGTLDATPDWIRGGQPDKDAVKNMLPNLLFGVTDLWDASLRIVS